MKENNMWHTIRYHHITDLVNYLNENKITPEQLQSIYRTEKSWVAIWYEQKNDEPWLTENLFPFWEELRREDNAKNNH